MKYDFKTKPLTGELFTGTIEKYHSSAIININSPLGVLEPSEISALAKKAKALFSTIAPQGIYSFDYPEKVKNRGFLTIQYVYISKESIKELKNYLVSIDFGGKMDKILNAK